MPEYKTRSGRVTKKPERLDPDEDCEDDFKADEYDSDSGSDVSSTVSRDEDDDDYDDDSDDSFVVDDEEEVADDDDFDEDEAEDTDGSE